MINDNNIVDFENEKLFSETQLSSIIFSIKREENNKKSKKIMLKGQFEEVTSVALISSNKYVVSGSKDKTIRIWNLLKKKTRNCFARPYFYC